VTVVAQGESPHLVEVGWYAVQLRHGHQSVTPAYPIEHPERRAEVRRSEGIGIVPTCRNCRNAVKGKRFSFIQW
jgi:hypothetical protein